MRSVTCDDLVVYEYDGTRFVEARQPDLCPMSDEELAKLNDEFQSKVEAEVNRWGHTD